MARVLITGGAGFIGSHVAEAFRAAGHEVAIVDNLATGRRDNLPSGARFLHADITDVTDLANTVAWFAGQGRER